MIFTSLNADQETTSKLTVLQLLASGRLFQYEAHTAHAAL